MALDGMRKTADSGMTLVEMLVAISLLTVFFISAIQVVTRMSQRADSVRERATATLLAWNRLQRMHHLPFEDVLTLEEPPPGTRINADGLPDANGRFLRHTIVEMVSTNATAQMANVRVKVWSQSRRTHRFELAEHPEIVETLVSPLTRADP